MNRHFQYAALVLRLRALGGAGEMSHREGYFLTPGEGVVRAAVYGGAKSKLRAYVSPFQSGTLYLYHNPARDTRKVCDFDVSAWRPEIRERLERTLTASAVAEALLAGQGGGSESAAAFALANQTLDALACAGEKLCEKVYVHFLWHWLDILGLKPENAAETLPPAARRYLAVTQNLPPAALERYTPDEASFAALKTQLAGIFADATGKPR